MISQNILEYSLGGGRRSAGCSSCVGSGTATGSTMGAGVYLGLGGTLEAVRTRGSRDVL